MILWSTNITYRNGGNIMNINSSPNYYHLLLK